MLTYVLYLSTKEKGVKSPQNHVNVVYGSTTRDKQVACLGPNEQTIAEKRLGNGTKTPKIISFSYNHANLMHDVLYRLGYVLYFSLYIIICIFYPITPIYLDEIFNY